MSKEETERGETRRRGRRGRRIESDDGPTLEGWQKKKENDGLGNENGGGEEKAREGRREKLLTFYQGEVILLVRS